MTEILTGCKRDLALLKKEPIRSNAIGLGKDSKRGL